jgi:glycosyltransferase involved in cell wall biosynthesis
MNNQQTATYAVGSLGFQAAFGETPIPRDWTQHSVSIVIPALNEAENLPHVLPRIPNWVHEVVLVDGGSSDGTPEIAHRLRPEIKVITERRKGKGAALQAGFETVTGDIVVMLDADGSMDAGEIPLFVGALLAGADFVKGSRFLQGGGTNDMEWYRRVGNAGLRMLVRLEFGGQFSDLCYGYIGFWRHILSVLKIDSDGFEVEAAMNVRALKARLRIAEVPSFEDRRLYGQSNLRTIPDGWRVLRTIISERWRTDRMQTA